MIDENKRLVEVNEVLLQLNKKDMDKIPKEVILNIRDKMDKKYNWKYDQKKDLSEQGLSKDTIAILSYINLEYLLDEEQKELMNQIYKNNEIKKQKELKQKYNSNNIFKDKQETKVVKKENLPIEIKKESLLKRVVNFIKNLINRRTN